MKSAMPVILLFGLFLFFKVANWMNRPFKKEEDKKKMEEACKKADPAKMDAKMKADCEKLKAKK